MRALRNALNPLSTAFSRWWCDSSLRAIASGKPRDFYRQRLPARPVPAPPLDPAVRHARIEEIERIIGADRD